MMRAVRLAHAFVTPRFAAHPLPLCAVTGVRRAGGVAAVARKEDFTEYADTQERKVDRAWMTPVDLKPSEVGIHPACMPPAWNSCKKPTCAGRRVTFSTHYWTR